MFTAVINFVAKMIFDVLVMVAILYGVVCICLGSKAYEIIRNLGGVI